MSNVIDLFAKRSDAEQRGIRQRQKLKHFLNVLSEPDRLLGGLFKDAITETASRLHQSWMDCLAFGYQVRQDGGQSAIYFIGRSMLHRNFTGEKNHPPELFQVRFMARPVDVAEQGSYPMLGLAERMDRWITRNHIQETRLIYPAVWLLGALQSPAENFLIKEIRDHNNIFEVHLGSYNGLCRVRIYADALLSDQKTLLDLNLIPGA
jgi:hypothetical protein